MVNVKNVVYLGLLLAAGILIYIHFFESDEAKIRRRFDELKIEMQKDSAETGLAAAAKARRIGKMFTDPCSLEIPSHSVSGIYSRRELISTVFAARSRYRTISLHFYDIHIEFEKNQSASVDFTVIANVLPRGEAGRIPYQEVQELRCMLKRNKGEWLFSKVETVEVLQK